MPTTGKHKSGNPAKKVSTAAEFKKAKGSALVELPTGNTVSIKRPGLAVLLTEGILGDQLSVLAQEAVDNAQGVPQVDLAMMAKDPTMITKLIATVSRVAVFCWVDPRVHYHLGVEEDGAWRPAKADETGAEPIPDEFRDPEALYSDEIELTDLMFTFQFVSGGSSDLARFRQELDTAMASLSAGEGVADQAV